MGRNMEPHTSLQNSTKQRPFSGVFEFHLTEIQHSDSCSSSKITFFTLRGRRDLFLYLENVLPHTDYQFLRPHAKDCVDYKDELNLLAALAEFTM